MSSADYLIAGGGVIGLTTALELKRQFPNSSILLLEKEERCGKHASGRNSGVLHAGFYYTPDSFKAQFTRKGNVRLTRYCHDKNIPLNKCGKLVVAKNGQDLTQLEVLLNRAQKNGVPLESVDEQDAAKIEPKAKTFERALFSPTTSSVDPALVMNALIDDALSQGIQIKTGVRYTGRTLRGVQTSSGEMECGYFINAGGLHADRIARDFGFSRNYRILPFKGLYLYSTETQGPLKTHVYPVPDLRNPFLGVHFTVTPKGQVKIGPTAIPAFWREQYKGGEGFGWKEFGEILCRHLSLVISSNFDFKRLAYEELKKYSKTHLVHLASELVQGIPLNHFTRWGPAGIRAQLVNIKSKALEMDFVLEGDKHSLHILNAVSPAFTCAFPFAEHVVEKILALTG